MHVVHDRTVDFQTMLARILVDITHMIQRIQHRQVHDVTHGITPVRVPEGIYTSEFQLVFSCTEHT